MERSMMAGASGLPVTSGKPISKETSGSLSRDVADTLVQRAERLQALVHVLEDRADRVFGAMPATAKDNRSDVPPPLHTSQAIERGFTLLQAALNNLEEQVHRFDSI